MLEQIAKTGFDRSLVSGLDVEVVGDGALLIHRPVGLHEHGARGVAIGGAGRVELFERLQARVQAGQFVLPGADGPRAPLVLNPGAGQFGLAGRARDTGRLDGLVRPAQPLGSGGAIGRHALGLNAAVPGFHVQLRQRLADAVACRRRMFHRVPQRGGRVEGREHFAAGRLDVGIEAFDLAMRGLVRLGVRGQRRRGAVPLGVGVERRGAPRLDQRARRFPARIERLELGGDRRRPGVERLHLIAVEQNLLLLAVDRQFACMRGLA